MSNNVFPIRSSPGPAAVTIVFTGRRPNGPPNLVTEVELHFHEECGPLAGLKLTGLAIRLRPNGTMYVTLPAKAYGSGAARTYFDFVKPIHGADTTSRRSMENWIIDQYRRSRR